METLLLSAIAILLTAVVFQHIKITSHKRTIQHKNALIHVLRYRLDGTSENSLKGFKTSQKLSNDEMSKVKASTIAPNPSYCLLANKCNDVICNKPNNCKYDSRTKI